MRTPLRPATPLIFISPAETHATLRQNHPHSCRKSPKYRGPIRETRQTLQPSCTHHYDTAEGYGPNKVAAELVALKSGLPISILRPARIHGAGASRPREWVFVESGLDRRPTALLAAHGSGVVHTTAAANLAALIETVALKPGARILNSADPDAPSALEILAHDRPPTRSRMAGGAA